MTLNDLLQLIITRYDANASPQGRFIDAVSAVQEVIANRLWLVDSDILRSTHTGVARAENSKYLLPSTVLGLAEMPWAVNDTLGKGRELHPVEMSRRYTYEETGPVEAFEQKGLALYLYPAPDIDTTIKTEVYRKPDPFSSLDEELPWDGMFDQVFIEATIRFNLGSAFVALTPEMEQFLFQRVDRLMEHRNKKSILWKHPA